MDKTVIALVEDDAMIRELVAYNLDQDGYETHAFEEGGALFHALERLTPSLFILDVMLPGMDGFAICQRLRQDPRTADRPIMMLTARSGEQDKVYGLDQGADDYMVKPFGVRELLARVHALLRRAARAGAGQAQAREAAGLRCRDIWLDDVAHRVFKGEREVEVTHREYELLRHLMRHPGVAFTRDDLLSAIWGYDYAGETRTVDVHIRGLRRKLEDDAANPVLIETVRGRGYRFCEK